MAVEGVLLVMKRKPFVNKFDDEDLVGVGEPRESAAMTPPVDQVAGAGWPVHFCTEVHAHGN